MADQPQPCPNCGMQRFTNAPYCPHCGAHTPGISEQNSGWFVLKAIVLGVLAIPFAALGGCAACFATGMTGMALPGSLGMIALPIALVVGIVVFAFLLISIWRQIR